MFPGSYSVDMKAKRSKYYQQMHLWKQKEADLLKWSRTLFHFAGDLVTGLMLTFASEYNSLFHILIFDIHVYFRE